MAWFKKVVYEIKGRERGMLEAFSAQQQIAGNAIAGLLKQIVEREKIAPESVFEPSTWSFVKPPKKQASVDQQ